MDFVVAIVSHNRSDSIFAKTITTLSMCGVPSASIYVFVAPDEMMDYVGKVGDCNLCVGAVGLVANRRAIETYFPEGKRIVCMDDDIESIDFSLSDEIGDFKTLVNKGFEMCYLNDAYLWGVYPVFNPYFRKNRPEVVVGLYFIVGCIHGIINRPSLAEIQNSICVNKEDVEKSIKYFLNDGKVIRFDRIGFKTKYFNSVGGLGGLRDRINDIQNEAVALHTAYKSITKLKIRKNGVYEVVLKPVGEKKKKCKSICDVSLNEDVSLCELSPYFLPTIDADNELVQNLYAMLVQYTVPMCSNKTGRAPRFGRHRSVTFGMIRGRCTRKYGLSVNSVKYPELWEAIQKLGKAIVPFEWSAVYLNHNVVTPRHLDPHNSGVSCIVALGDYEGCDLVIEGHGTYNINMRPLVFDGSKNYHYNTPLISGDKYSLVFFHNDH